MALELATGPANQPIPEISRQEMIHRLNDPSLLVVDVLPPTSYKARHIPGSINVPLEDIGDSVRELLPDLNAEIALYCGGFT